MKTIIKFLKSLFTKKCKHINSKMVFVDWQERCTKYHCLDCNETFYTDL